ncbi:LPS assembly protein LptD [Cereibacter sphaeroides]|nr:LPS assembly protein LptD [Cereibacter sphaeroides]
MADKTRKSTAISRVALAARSRLRPSVPALALMSALALAAPVQAQTAIPATLMADQVFVDPAGRLVAQGSVEIWHGSIRLTAQRVSYDQSHDSLILEGPLTISDGPDVVVLADQAQLAPALRAGVLTSARLVLDQQLQIAAARMERGTNGVSQLDSVVASSCPVCATNPTPLWEIRAERVQHDENRGQLRFYRTQFRLAGVPIFYAPRLDIPAPGNNRLRGLLRPEVSADSTFGVTVGLPYFIPIGDTQDVTITPSLSSNGMASLGLRYRLARENGGIEVGGQISHDDLLPGQSLRGYGYVRALFNLSHDWVLTADVLAASEASYLDTYNITDDPRLHGHITLERIRRDHATRVRLLGFYSMRPGDVNDRLPNVAVQGETEHHHTLAGGALTVGMSAHGYYRESNGPFGAGRDVGRAALDLGWRRSEVLPGGVLTTVAFDARAEHVRIYDDIAYPDPVNRQAAQAMVEFRWPLARAGADGARQVLEPIVQVIESRRSGPGLPNDDHTMPELDEGNLFAFRRYSGEDASDDGSRINAGMRWARHDPDGWTAEALVGRIWRDAPLQGYPAGHSQPLGDTESHWLLAGRVSNTDGYALSMRFLVDPDNSVSRSETNLSWSTARTDVSTTYLYLPASSFESRAFDLSEWQFDLTRRHNNGWATTFGWDYDVGQNLWSAARGGLSFTNECLAVELTVERIFVTPTNSSGDTRFDLSVDLLGIGGRAPSSNSRTCRT